MPYIREEKAKVQRFISSLPLNMREGIEFDNPKMMDEVIHKAKICYQQSKQKGEILGKRWIDKRSNKLAGNNKGNRGGGNKGFAKGKNSRNIQKNPLRSKPTNESKISEQRGKIDNEGTTQPPMQCWGCDAPHYIKNYPKRKGTEQDSQIHEASTVNNVGRSLPRISATLEDRQAEYQPTMVEFEDELGAKQELKRIKRPVQIRPIIASQLAKCIRKGCQIYAIQVGYANSKNKTATLENIPVIQEFADVFSEEILGLPPKRDKDFTIELVLGVDSVFQAPYRMSTIELKELKMQLHELLDKNYIRPSVLPWEPRCC
eukprot:PITA_02988